MPVNFLQYLIIFLIMLLFAEKYIPALLEKWGIKVKKNGNGNGDAKIDEIHKELHEIKNNHLFHINKKLTEFEVKIDLLMKKYGQ